MAAAGVPDRDGPRVHDDRRGRGGARPVRRPVRRQGRRARRGQGRRRHRRPRRGARARARLPRQAATTRRSSIEEFLDGPEVSLFCDHRRHDGRCRCSRRRTSSASATATPAPTPAAWAPTRPLPWAPPDLVDRRDRARRPADGRRACATAARRSRGCSTPASRMTSRGRARHRVQRPLRRPRDPGRAGEPAIAAGPAAASPPPRAGSPRSRRLVVAVRLRRHRRHRRRGLPGVPAHRRRHRRASPRPPTQVGVDVFHAGTDRHRRRRGRLGRRPGAVGDRARRDLARAREHAYAAVDLIRLRGLAPPHATSRRPRPPTRWEDDARDRQAADPQRPRRALRVRRHDRHLVARGEDRDGAPAVARRRRGAGRPRPRHPRGGARRLPRGSSTRSTSPRSPSASGSPSTTSRRASRSSTPWPATSTCTWA